MGKSQNEMGNNQSDFLIENVVDLRKTLNRFIEHTLLKPDARESDFRELFQQAKEHNFLGICVPSSWVPFSCSLWKDLSQEAKTMKLVSVTGFPHGNSSTYSKCKEAEQAVQDGAHEIDMVIAIGRLKSRDYNYLKNDIAEVVRASAPSVVKVIIETCLLTNEEKEIACFVSRDAGAHFVKTSTGFNGGGATLSDIELMKRCVGQQMEIKASGGIKTKEFALQLIAAGASRLGTSSGVDLVSIRSKLPGLSDSY